MTQTLPTDEQVQQAMDQVLTQSAETGRAPTITAVERRLGIRHATFYRHYQHQITGYFHPRAQRTRPPAADDPGNNVPETAQQTLQRVRQENTELRKLVQIYAETIRQLTVDHTALSAELDKSRGGHRVALAPTLRQKRRLCSRQLLGCSPWSTRPGSP
ncbi:hypothetical protein ACOZ38_29485 [Sphaerisporangium viridialbum]|uniref:hypothetical protein n=1 Tax=Sphaerisporangium viridialbum TaxID=46189 RepID=UPI003C72194E